MTLSILCDAYMVLGGWSLVDSVWGGGMCVCVCLELELELEEGERWREWTLYGIYKETR